MWPLYRKKAKLGTSNIFGPFLLPRSQSFGGNFPTFFLSQSDDFSVLLGPRNHGFSVAYLQKNIPKTEVSFPPSFWCQEARGNFGGPFPTCFLPSQKEYFLVFSAQETMDSVWPICRKRFMNGLIFPLISAQE